MTITDTMVCTCGGGPTTEVYHARECPLYRVQRAGSDLLAALIDAERLLKAVVDGDMPHGSLFLQIRKDARAAIRKATED